ncbi:MAG: hypothetical protein PHU35_04270 [Bacteroidales bacterium]|nr:hypothetical protein [Syntrophomonas sp.]MDD4001985.1 hypothetical protein [Bacteroidales bacterium]
MATTDIRLKKLYDSMGSMISNLHLQKGNLSHEEMYCLLSVLDYTWMGKSDPSFIALLREWQASELEPEINEIIKATLLSVDFKKPASVLKNMEIIRGLIRYNNELKDS